MHLYGSSLQRARHPFLSPLPRRHLRRASQAVFCSFATRFGPRFPLSCRMGGGPSSEAKSHYVQLVWTTGACGAGGRCCPGLKELRGECPSWLKGNLEKIQELGAPYGGCLLFQMDCCGSPVCPSPFADEAQNEPLKEMRKQFPQYTFSFQPHWVGPWQDCALAARLADHELTSPGGGASGRSPGPAEDVSGHGEGRACLRQAQA